MTIPLLPAAPRSWLVWLAALCLGVGVILQKYASFMDGYEIGILIGATLGLAALGWHWSAMRWFTPAVAALALVGINAYQSDLNRGMSSGLLKYGLASQSAIMWLCVLTTLATLYYWIAFFRPQGIFPKIATGLTWAGAVMALVGLLVRWYESYLLGADIGHIPVSNLYEVFVLFCLITLLMYLYYEARFQTKALGAFVLLVINAAVGFILWYSFDKQAHLIQPLIPALQSWWMKIHVPANFIGYGAFALAAMVGAACLVGELMPAMQSRLPPMKTLDEIMYRAIAVGFLFFTIATLLGAAWAADAWGSYWSWDPKETWALIVWLNYAAWLHFRLIKGLPRYLQAAWAVVGLLVTSFAFLGVNMYLSGLHSYGKL